LADRTLPEFEHVVVPWTPKELAMDRFRPKETKVVDNEPQKKPRGRPFEPGNPGRPPGSKNRTTRLIEELLEGQAESLGRKFIDLALAGNPRCLQAALDRLLPKRHGRTLDFELPPINNIQDISAAMAAIGAGLTAGRLTPEEADHVIAYLRSFEKHLELRDLVARLEAIEERLAKK
jgi:hypothetical protein